MASLAPALIALRGEELTAYHGAEHVSIGTYETGERASKEHERCGSHLVGPLTIATALAGAAAELAPRGIARRHDSSGLSGRSAPRSRCSAGWHGTRRSAFRGALARPGTELQRRLSTSEPSEAQLEVAEAALQTVLAAEQAAS